MLNDLYVLKDGLPIFINNEEAKPTITSKKAPMVKIDQVTMISGFFSAMNSFATQVGNFGEMKELKMTNNIKFSFFKPKNTENLLFVATSENDVNQKILENLLNKTSSEFLRAYPMVKKKNWNGETTSFEKFNDNLISILKETELSLQNEIKHESHSNKEIASVILNNRGKIDANKLEKFENFGKLEKLVEIDKSNKSEITREFEENNNFEEIFGDYSLEDFNLENKTYEKRISNSLITNKIRNENLQIQRNNTISFQKAKNENFMPYSKELFYNLVPVKRIEKEEGIEDFFSGEDSKKVFSYIDGKQSIENISMVAGIKNERTFSLCKCFIKMGLISFTN